MEDRIRKNEGERKIRKNRKNDKRKEEKRKKERDERKRKWRDTLLIVMRGKGIRRGREIEEWIKDKLVKREVKITKEIEN